MNQSNSLQLIDEILTDSKSSSVNRRLHESNSVESLKNLITMAITLNELSLIDKRSLIEASNNSNLFLTTFGPKTNVSFDLIFNDLNSVQPNYLALKIINITSVEYESKRNLRSSIREKLIGFIVNISIFDVTSIKFQSAFLAEITADCSELTRQASDQVIKQIYSLLETLNQVDEKIYVEDLIEIINNLANTMSNILQGLSNMVNKRQPTLYLDYIRAIALPIDYDTDPENFWTNTNNFNEENSTIDENKNLLMQKFLVTEAIQIGRNIIDKLSNSLAEHSPLGNKIYIPTTSIQLSLGRLTASELNLTIFEGLGKFELPSFCELLGHDDDVNLNNNLSDYFDWNDLDNCTNEIVTVQIIARPFASSGLNSDNETKIGLSNSMSLKFFNSKKIEIPIKKSKKPIHIYIPRDPSISFPNFYHINTSNLGNESQYLPNYFNVSATNASIHVNLIPSDLNTGYFIALKLDRMPLIERDFIDVDKWDILCPKNLNEISSKNLSYIFFMNQSEVNGHKGFVGVAIRELNSEEFFNYCENNTEKFFPNYEQNSSFTSDFYLRFFTSGCYYLNEETGRWSSHGIDIMWDTNEKFTHCVTTHLTEFAGGLVILPAEINFQYVWENASIKKNPVIYSTVIVLSCIYILLMIWGRYKDKKDSSKIGICLLSDNQPTENYFYEIIVFTGSRRNAETNSKVSLMLSGDKGDTKPRVLNDPKRRCFRRGGVDSFILSVNDDLGYLNYIRIWHDNSGKGNKASWFLKFIIIRDLQTDKKFYFLSQKWFALEKEDGLIDRILPAVYDLKNSNLKILIDLQTKQDIADGHLWFSIFTRPAQSSFSRIERITCCFVLLLVTMLINIMYYEIDSSVKYGGLQVGTFFLSTEQFATGIISSLLIFPPNLLLVEIFRRSKCKKKKYENVKKILNRSIKSQNFEHGNMKDDDDDSNVESIDVDSKQSISKFSLRLPSWFKITGFLISSVLIIVSIFFILVKGIEFGDDKVKKWLNSLIISLLSSIFLTQPIKVTLIALFFIIVLRKPKNYDDDNEKIKLENTKLKESKISKRIDFTILDDFMPLSPIEMSEARRDRLNEIKFKTIIKEIYKYLIFLFLIYMCAFAYRDNSSYTYQKALRNLFLGRKFNTMDSIEDFWNWTRAGLASGLRAQPWYNGFQPYNLAGFINDYSSRLIGYGILRQIRIKNDSCVVKKIMGVDFCNEDYDFLNEEKGNFGLNWTNLHSNNTSFINERRVLDAFKYRTGDDLESYPYMGVYNSYSGAGFVYELRGSLKQLIGNLTTLQKFSWIDRKTRAVFAEFTVFNPNIKLLCVVTILVEFLPTGNLIKSARMEPVNIFDEFGSFFAYKTLISIIYVLMVIFFMIREIILIFKFGWSYFKKFWSYVDWLIIIFSWICVAVYLYRFLLYNKALDFFQKTSGFAYIKLQSMTYWNEFSTFCVALCCALTTFKFTKLLRFSPRLSLLASTIKCGANELMGFGIMFSIVWFSMVQIFYLYFNDKMTGFSTITKSMGTCFQIMLGKFQVDPLIKAHKSLGPLFFAFYNIIIVFIFLNLFISIVNETFIMVKRDAEIHFYHNDFLNNLFKKLNFAYVFFRPKKEIEKINQEMSKIEPCAFQDHITLFPKKSDQLIELISDLYREQAITNYVYSEKINEIKNEINNSTENKQKVSSNDFGISPQENVKLRFSNQVRPSKRTIDLNY